MLRVVTIGEAACRPALLSLLRTALRGPAIETLADLDQGLLHLQKCRDADLALIDIDPPAPRWIETLKSVRAGNSQLHIAILSAFDTRVHVHASLAAGFRGFISKRQPDEQIAAALTEIVAGGVYAPWTLIGQRDETPDFMNLPRLTARQLQVLRLISVGMSNKEIAHALCIAESTTKIHTALLMRALGVRNRTEAAFKAGKLLCVLEAH